MRKVFFAAMRRAFLIILLCLIIIGSLSRVIDDQKVIKDVFSIFISLFPGLPIFSIFGSLILFMVGLIALFVINLVVGLFLYYAGKINEIEPVAYSPYQKEILINLTLNLEFLIITFAVPSFLAPIDSLMPTIFMDFFWVSTVMTAIRMIYIRVYYKYKLNEPSAVNPLKSKAFIISEFIVVTYVMLYLLPIPLPFTPAKVGTIFKAVNAKQGKLAIASLDGRLFVKDYSTDKTEVFLIDRRAGNIFLSPDGKKIAYTVIKPGFEPPYSYQLAIIDLETGEKKLFENNINGSENTKRIMCRWSQDGEALYFAENTSTYHLDIETGKINKISIIDSMSWGEINQNGDMLTWMGRVVSKEGRLIMEPKGFYEKVSAWAFSGKAIFKFRSREGQKGSIVVFSYPGYKKIKEWEMNEKMYDIFQFTSNPSGTKVIFEHYYLDTKKNLITKIAYKKNPDGDNVVISGESINWINDNKILFFNETDTFFGPNYDLLKYDLLKNTWTDLNVKGDDIKSFDFWSKQTSMKNTLPTVSVKKK